MTEFIQYRGNCHCGLFKFTFKSPDITSLSIRQCDCSICIRKACLWVYPAAQETFLITSESGEDRLSRYEFGDRNIEHFFCPKCGSAVIARRKLNPQSPSNNSGGLGINARVIQSLHPHLNTLKTTPVPEKDLRPPHTFVNDLSPPPEFMESMKDAEKLYKGSCHCGGVTYTVKMEALEEQEKGVISCNCSLCSRNGELYVYPPRSSVFLPASSLDNLTGYPFLSTDSLHCFCKICGVSVLVSVLVEGEDLCPLNVRCLEGFGDLMESGGLMIRHYDGASSGSAYIEPS